MKVALVIAALMVLPSLHADASMIGMEQLKLDFTKGRPHKARWSTPHVITANGKGLGWDGNPAQSRDGWILTDPVSVGVSWRPTSIVNVTVSIAPGPRTITLKNGQKISMWPGRAFVRYSADKKHWSSWQALSYPGSTQTKAPVRAAVYRGMVAVPRRNRIAYDRLLQKFQRSHVPWPSDEDALARQITARQPSFFRSPIPFVGYVQVLYEGQFWAGIRLTKLNVNASYVVGGMHLPPRDKALYKGRSGPWRFSIK